MIVDTLNPPNFFGTPNFKNAGEWRWTFSPTPLTTAAISVTHALTFDTRLDAQAWLGENASTLSSAGVTAAQLTCLDKPIGQAVQLL